jgi:hypothetical protein
MAEKKESQDSKEDSYTDPVPVSSGGVDSIFVDKSDFDWGPLIHDLRVNRKGIAMELRRVLGLT